ncbi:MAG: cation:dicarboxylate symporter family transporter [Planctomycetota bacterium]|jgi:Na+/H+-dicarboxylate symporter
MALGTKILIGVLAGIALGVFLGELAAPFDVAGKVYVSLLQMTVLPYVTVSLMIKIGSLTFDAARRLAGRAGIVLLALWAISLVTVFFMAQSLPSYQAGSFFTASLVERPSDFDFLGLYLPTNPFHSLANNIVPAVVLFSILVGVALIGIRNKERLLEPLKVFGDALGRISDFVVRLSPYGTFALSAGAAGSLSPADLIRLSGYVSTYTVAILVLTFVVLPMFASAVTPISFWQMIKGTRQAVLTAFATGKLFAVLPMVIADVKNMLVGQGMDEEQAESTADVFVPLAYPFPNAGKVLSLLFIPFAGWFSGQPLEFADYPLLLTVGLFAFFGSPVAAIPFLLDMFRLPADMLPLFLIAGIWCARLGDMLGAVHLTVFSVVSAAWNQGLARLSPPRLGAWAAVTTVVGLAALFANRGLVSASIASEPPVKNRVVNMDLLNEVAEIVAVDEESAPNPDALREGETLVDRIRRTQTLRVGYVPSKPFAYENARDAIVGFDIDLVQRLASDLDAVLRLIPTTADRIAEGLVKDHFDIAVGGIPSSLRNLEQFDESAAYLDLHAALLVNDHRVKEFASLGAILSAKGLKIGYARGGLLVRTKRHAATGVSAVEVDQPSRFVGEEDILAAMGVDAFLTTAEQGAVLAMVYPQLSVVVPQDIHVRVPIVVALQKSAPLERVIDTWINLKTHDGTIDALYKHWILGKRATRKDRRWSVVHDVLRWVD